ncbi:hypothetical protein V475_06650 [Sphingobium baderi LL03]|uniref:Uncharacterized protein n=1 Tax=Sphingobium baderi LL03 TaxID=1114964 RepID=T0GQS4_9SPHN|nr:hypothetical protein L485_01170 [Sphingobium baderi LL03]KMS62721.1 hypothetical protein V475_06650 [Sphingobium baderi LL03]
MPAIDPNMTCAPIRGGGRRSQRIDRLREGQAAMRALRRSQIGDQRICGNLQYSDTARQYEERGQEHAESRAGGGGNEEQASCRHRPQPQHDAAPITEPRDERSGGQGNDCIGREKGELRQHRLRIAELEKLLELGNQDIVEAGDAAPEEEQRDDQPHPSSRHACARPATRACLNGGST